MLKNLNINRLFKINLLNKISFLKSKKTRYAIVLEKQPKVTLNEKTSNSQSINKWSKRMQNLGTETAYKVADEASEYAKKAKNYPFHIGDLNFPPSKCFVDAMNNAIVAGKVGYCSAAGISELRDALADYVGKNRGVKYSRENVSIQSGGKPGIGKFLMVCINPGDEVLFPR